MKFVKTRKFALRPMYKNIGIVSRCEYELGCWVLVNVEIWIRDCTKFEDKVGNMDFDGI